MGRVRPPLGVLYRGVCRADSDQATAPRRDLLEHGCNFGYARALCDRLPQDAGPDAVRFSITSDDGRCVRVWFTIEKGHLPDSHGRLVYDREAADWEGIEARTLLHEQAQAYLNSYLNAKGGPAVA